MSNAKILQDHRRVRQLIDKILDVQCGFCGNTLIEQNKPRDRIRKYYKYADGEIYSVEYILEPEQNLNCKESK